MNLKLSQKLPMIIVGVALLSSLVTGFIAINISSSNAVDAAEKKLIALNESRKVALKSYLHSIEQDLSSLSRSEYVKQALLDFKEHLVMLVLMSISML